MNLTIAQAARIKTIQTLLIGRKGVDSDVMCDDVYYYILKR